MSFNQDTEQPVVRLRQRVLGNHIIELYKYLDIDPGNLDLVNTNFFQVEKSKSRAVELRFFNDES